jgi:hypothetical protein
MAYNRHGRVTSLTPGTPTQIASASTPVARVSFQAIRNNTGFVAIGGKNVRARDGEQNSRSLAVPATSAPQMRDLTNVDLADLYLDVTVANEGVVFDYD